MLWRLYFYDGVRDILVATVNPSTGLMIPAPQEFNAAIIGVAAASYNIAADGLGRWFQFDIGRPTTIITLPAAADIFDGWYCIIQANGVPANGASQVFQVAQVRSQGTTNIIYDATSMLIGTTRAFVLIGYGEMFRFTYSNGQWIVVLIMDGSGKNNSVYIFRTFFVNGLNNANSGSASWTVAAMTSSPTGPGLLFNWANALYTVPVSGWYNAFGWVAQGWGTTAGTGYVGVGPSVGNPALYDENTIVASSSAATFLNNMANVTVYLLQGQTIGLFHQESATSLYWFPESSYFTVRFYGRS